MNVFVRTSRPSVLLIGASTGGPQALTALIGALAPAVPQLPVCVTLHMPPELVPVIAMHVTRTCSVTTHIVRDPCELRPGVVYFAPGDRHLEFTRRTPAQVLVRLKSGAPQESCKPAIDVMFGSAATCFGARALAVVLSGMGHDGLAGARALASVGAQIIVQDKVTSAVWGMPGAVAKANLASAILTPRGLAENIIARLNSFVRSA